MMLQRVAFAALFPLVTSYVIYPGSTDINTPPLCHNTYDESDFSPDSKVDVKAYLAINHMCPVQLFNLDLYKKRKMAFTSNPFRSDSMTISDGILLARCMIVRGIQMARMNASRGLVTSRKMIVSAIDISAQKYQAASKNFQRFCSEPFTFADHIMPGRGGVSNGIALIACGIIAIATMALEIHQRTLAKLLKKDEAAVAKVEAELKKSLYIATRQEASDHCELEKSSIQSETINEAIEVQLTASNCETVVSSGHIPSVTEEQPEIVSAEKSLGPGETSSEGSESGSTFLETPPPTPPRYMIDMNLKNAVKIAKDEMTTTSKSPKRKRKFGFKLRRKDKSASTI